jgi:hypothetical protein
MSPRLDSERERIEDGVDLGDPVAVKRQERGLDDVDHPAVPTRRRDVLGLRPDDPELDYTCADEHAYRLFWDPDSQKLSIDDSWTVPYLAEGSVDRGRSGHHGRLDHDPDERHRRKGPL